MAHKHYDILVLGESLAAQIAAVLLARSGRRVLLLRKEAGHPIASGWIPLSRHLEGVLELLGGRSCLVAPTPFQVITGQCRLTVHGCSSLVDELRREFATDCDRVAAVLNDLREIGTRLENALWQAGGLPLTGAASRWRFTLQSLRHKLAGSVLRRPLGERIARCATAQARDALETLFTGLALSPGARLSSAEGALLWRCFSEERGVSTSALAELLEHRFEQFHGETAQSKTLRSMNYAGQRLSEAVFANGQRCTAETVLLGSREMVSLLPPALQGAIALPPAAGLIEARVSGRISPLLAPGILLGGEPTLRLSLNRTPGNDGCRITAEAASAEAPLSSEEFGRRLSMLAPFAGITMESFGGGSAEQGADARRRGGGAFPGATRAFSAGSNLYVCSGEMVLPALGATGEVLAATTLANHLQQRQRKQ